MKTLVKTIRTVLLFFIIGLLSVNSYSQEKDPFKNMTDEFDEFEKTIQDDFSKFVEKIDEDFAAHLEKAWAEMALLEGKEPPSDPKPKETPKIEKDEIKLLFLLTTTFSSWY